ncbi:dTDP-4-dehydrorhamnose 3,5-epimerase family protein [Streptomyces sp. NPDC000851]
MAHGLHRRRHLPPARTGPVSLAVRPVPAGDHHCQGEERVSVMQVRTPAIEGVREFTPQVFGDDRGCFASPYQEATFSAALGRPLFPVKDISHNMSARGVLRGIHYTATPPGRAKYVYCPYGRVLDFLVDLRVGSPTFGRWEATELSAEGDCGTVARAAYEGARAALAATPGQLAVLERAGVVDAGGRGLVAVLAALVETFTGEVPGTVAVSASVRHARVGSDTGQASRGGPGADDAAECADGVTEGGPAYEVIYLLEADDASVARLRQRLDALGDSLVVVGGDGLWNVHVHVDDAGAAVEAGVEAGRPYRIRITHFAADDVHTSRGERPARERAERAVVAVVPGEGLAGLYAEAGATTVLARPGEPPVSGELVEAVRRAHAREVVLLPNDAELRHTAAAAAEQARAEGIRVALIPTRSAVQGIAALAVHEPERRFDEDVVSMTSAAGSTRYGEVVVAERQSWTMAGICQAGDVLGLIDGDVAVIGSDVTATAESVLDRMLAAGGELVTLVLGDEVPESVAERLEARVREAYLAVDTVVYRGGRQGALLLIGVE